MSYQQKESRTTEETLLYIEDKIAVLRKLCFISQDIEKLQQSLNMLSSASGLKLKVNQNVKAIFEKLKEKVENNTSLQLSKSLKQLEAKINDTAIDLLYLAKLDYNLSNQQTDKSFKQFVPMLKQFESNVHLSLVLRAILQERGEKLKSCKLVSLPQETIQLEIKNLKSQRKKYHIRIRQKIVEVLDDLDSLGERAYPAVIRQQIMSTEKEMKENLEHIDSGKAISEMPHNFEVITLQSRTVEVSPPCGNESLPTLKTSSVDEHEAGFQSQSSQKYGVIRRFFSWLNAPWNKSWKDTK